MFLDPNQPLELFVKYFVILALRYFIIAGLAYFILWKWLRPRLARHKIQGYSLNPGQISREIRYSISTTFIFTFGGFYLFFMNFYDKGLFYQNISDYGWPYFFFSIFVMFVINDINFYWAHRLLHRPYFYNKFHIIHHQSRNTTPWTSFANHPFEALINLLFIFALPWLIPVHIKVIPVFALGSFLYNVYAHCGYDLIPSKWMKSVLVSWFSSSRHHNLHHEKVTGNYGLYFTYWDRLCGTVREPRVDLHSSPAQPAFVQSLR